MIQEVNVPATIILGVLSGLAAQASWVLGSMWVSKTLLFAAARRASAIRRELQMITNYVENQRALLNFSFRCTAGIIVVSSISILSFMMGYHADDSFDQLLGLILTVI